MESLRVEFHSDNLRPQPLSPEVFHWAFILLSVQCHQTVLVQWPNTPTTILVSISNLSNDTSQVIRKCFFPIYLLPNYTKWLSWIPIKINLLISGRSNETFPGCGSTCESVEGRDAAPTHPLASPPLSDDGSGEEGGSNLCRQWVPAWVLVTQRTRGECCQAGPDFQLVNRTGTGGEWRDAHTDNSLLSGWLLPHCLPSPPHLFQTQPLCGETGPACLGSRLSHQSTRARPGPSQ